MDSPLELSDLDDIDITLLEKDISDLYDEIKGAVSDDELSNLSEELSILIENEDISAHKGAEKFPSDTTSAQDSQASSSYKEIILEKVVENKKQGFDKVLFKAVFDSEKETILKLEEEKRGIGELNKDERETSNQELPASKIGTKSVSLEERFNLPSLEKPFKKTNVGLGYIFDPHKASKECKNQNIFGKKPKISEHSEDGLLECETKESPKISDQATKPESCIYKKVRTDRVEDLHPSRSPPSTFSVTTATKLHRSQATDTVNHLDEDEHQTIHPSENNPLKKTVKVRTDRVEDLHPSSSPPSTLSVATATKCHRSQATDTVNHLDEDEHQTIHPSENNPLQKTVKQPAKKKSQNEYEAEYDLSEEHPAVSNYIISQGVTKKFIKGTCGVSVLLRGSFDTDEANEKPVHLYLQGPTKEAVLCGVQVVKFLKNKAEDSEKLLECNRIKNKVKHGKIQKKSQPRDERINKKGERKLLQIKLKKRQQPQVEENVEREKFKETEQSKLIQIEIEKEEQTDVNEDREREKEKDTSKTKGEDSASEEIVVTKKNKLDVNLNQDLAEDNNEGKQESIEKNFYHEQSQERKNKKKSVHNDSEGVSNEYDSEDSNKTVEKNKRLNEKTQNWMKHKKLSIKNTRREKFYKTRKTFQDKEDRRKHEEALQRLKSGFCTSKIETEYSVDSLPDFMRNYVLEEVFIQGSQIKAATGASISIRGNIGSNNGMSSGLLSDRTPYLLIQGATHQVVYAGVEMIKKIVQEIKDRDSEKVGKVAIGMSTAPPMFNLVSRVEGSNGANLQFIADQSGAKVTLKGQGSSYLEPTTGLESPEPLNIVVEHKNMECVLNAKKLALSLVKAIQKDCINFCSGTLQPSGTFEPGSHRPATPPKVDFAKPSDGSLSYSFNSARPSPRLLPSSFVPNLPPLHVVNPKNEQNLLLPIVDPPNFKRPFHLEVPPIQGPPLPDNLPHFEIPLPPGDPVRMNSKNRNLITVPILQSTIPVTPQVRPKEHDNEPNLGLRPLVPPTMSKSLTETKTCPTEDKLSRSGGSFKRALDFEEEPTNINKKIKTMDLVRASHEDDFQQLMDHKKNTLRDNFDNNNGKNSSSTTNVKVVESAWSDEEYSNSSSMDICSISSAHISPVSSPVPSTFPSQFPPSASSISPSNNHSVFSYVSSTSTNKPAISSVNLSPTRTSLSAVIPSSVLSFGTTINALTVASNLSTSKMSLCQEGLSTVIPASLPSSVSLVKPLSVISPEPSTVSADVLPNILSSISLPPNDVSSRVQENFSEVASITVASSEPSSVIYSTAPSLNVASEVPSQVQETVTSDVSTSLSPSRSLTNSLPVESSVSSGVPSSPVLHILSSIASSELSPIQSVVSMTDSYRVPNPKILPALSTDSVTKVLPAIKIAPSEVSPSASSSQISHQPEINNNCSQSKESLAEKYEAKYVINDLPKRVRFYVMREGIYFNNRIKEFSGSTASLEGKYFPPGANRSMEKWKHPVYILLQGSSQQSVDSGIEMIENLIKEAIEEDVKEEEVRMAERAIKNELQESVLLDISRSACPLTNIEAVLKVLKKMLIFQIKIIPGFHVKSKLIQIQQLVDGVCTSVTCSGTMEQQKDGLTTVINLVETVLRSQRDMFLMQFSPVLNLLKQALDFPNSLLSANLHQNKVCADSVEKVRNETEVDCKTLKNTETLPDLLTTGKQSSMNNEPQSKSEHQSISQPDPFLTSKQENEKNECLYNSDRQIEVSPTKTTLQDKVSSTKTTLQDKVSSTKTTLQDKVSSTKTTLQDKVSSTKTTLQDKVSSTKTTLQDKVSSTKTTLQDKVSSTKTTLQDKVSSTKTTLQDKVSSTKTTLQDKVSSSKTTLQDKVSSTKTTLQDKVSSNKTTLQDKVSSNKTTLQVKVSSTKTTLQDKVSPTKTTLQDKVSSTKTTLQDKVSSTKTTLQDKVSSTKTTLQDKVSSTKTYKLNNKTNGSNKASEDPLHLKETKSETHLLNSSSTTLNKNSTIDQKQLTIMSILQSLTKLLMNYSVLDSNKRIMSKRDEFLQYINSFSKLISEKELAVLQKILDILEIFVPRFSAVKKQNFSDKLVTNITLLKKVLNDSSSSHNVHSVTVLNENSSTGRLEQFTEENDKQNKMTVEKSNTITLQDFIPEPEDLCLSSDLPCEPSSSKIPESKSNSSQKYCNRKSIINHSKDSKNECYVKYENKMLSNSGSPERSLKQKPSDVPSVQYSTEEDKKKNIVLDSVEMMKKKTKVEYKTAEETENLLNQLKEDKPEERTNELYVESETHTTIPLCPVLTKQQESHKELQSKLDRPIICSSVSFHNGKKENEKVECKIDSDIHMEVSPSKNGLQVEVSSSKAYKLNKNVRKISQRQNISLNDLETKSEAYILSTMLHRQDSVITGCTEPSLQVLGDSLARRLGFFLQRAWLPQGALHTTVDFAVSGLTVRGLKALIKKNEIMLNPLLPTVLFIGTNDVLQGADYDSLKQDHKSLVKLLRRTFPGILIIVAHIPVLPKVQGTCKEKTIRLFNSYIKSLQSPFTTVLKTEFTNTRYICSYYNRMQSLNSNAIVVDRFTPLIPIHSKRDISSQNEVLVSKSSLNSIPQVVEQFNPNTSALSNNSEYKISTSQILTKNASLTSICQEDKKLNKAISTVRNSLEDQSHKFTNQAAVELSNISSLSGNSEPRNGSNEMLQLTCQSRLLPDGVETLSHLNKSKEILLKTSQLVKISNSLESHPSHVTKLLTESMDTLSNLTKKKEECSSTLQTVELNHLVEEMKQIPELFQNNQDKDPEKITKAESYLVDVPTAYRTQMTPSVVKSADSELKKSTIILGNNRLNDDCRERVPLSVEVVLIDADQSVYASLAYLLLKDTINTKAALSYAATDLHKKAFSFIRNNKDMFKINEVCDQALSSHRLDPLKVFKTRRAFLEAPNNYVFHEPIRAIATIYRTPVIITYINGPTSDVIEPLVTPRNPPVEILCLEFYHYVPVIKPDSFVLGTWNLIRTDVSIPSEKMKMVDDCLEKHNVDVACLQCYVVRHPTVEMSTDNYSWRFSGGSKHNTGIAFLVRKKSSLTLRDFTPHYCNVASVDLTFRNEFYRIIGVDFSDRTNNNQLITVLPDVISQTPLSSQLVLLGDFKATIGSNTLTENEKQLIGTDLKFKNCNKNGTFLKHLARSYNLKIVSTFPNKEAMPDSLTKMPLKERNFQESGGGSHILVDQKLGQLWEKSLWRADEISNHVIVASTLVYTPVIRESKILEHLKVATWRVGDCSYEVRRNAVDTILQQLDIDLVCIQETNICVEGLLSTKHYNWWCSSSTNSIYNTAFLLRKGCGASLTDFMAYSKSVISAIISVGKFQYAVVGCYLIRSSFAQYSRTTNDIMLALRKAPLTAKHLLLGDFSAFLGPNGQQFSAPLAFRGKTASYNEHFMNNLVRLYDFFVCSNYQIKPEVPPEAQTGHILLKKGDKLHRKGEAKNYNVQQFKQGHLITYNLPVENFYVE